MVAQYKDEKGVDYVIDDKGVILYKGLIDKNKYPKEWDI